MQTLIKAFLFFGSFISSDYKALKPNNLDFV